MKKAFKVIGIAILSLMIIGFIMNGTDDVVNTATDKASNSLAAESIEAYEISYRNEDYMSAQAHANLAAQFYLQASEEADYKIWLEKAKEAEAKAMKQLGL